MDESSEGIDIPALKAYHKKKGTISGFPGAKTVRTFLIVAESAVFLLVGLLLNYSCDLPRSVLFVLRK